MALDPESSHAAAVAPDFDSVEFRRRRIESYLRSARTHRLTAAVEEQTATALERRGQSRAAAEHRDVAQEHRAKATRHRLLAESYSLLVPGEVASISPPLEAQVLAKKEAVPPQSAAAQIVAGAVAPAGATVFGKQ